MPKLNYYNVWGKASHVPGGLAITPELWRVVEVRGLVRDDNEPERERAPVISRLEVPGTRISKRELMRRVSEGAPGSTAIRRGGASNRNENHHYGDRQQEGEQQRQTEAPATTRPRRAPRSIWLGSHLYRPRYRYGG